MPKRRKHRVVPTLSRWPAPLAANAASLDALRDAIERFDLCELKRGARSTVFADGNPAARVMVIGDVPGRDEDREGRPFAGPAGPAAGPHVRCHRHGPRRA